MIIDEKLLDIPFEPLAEIIKTFHVRIAVIPGLDRDQSVVAFSILLLTLFALDQADYATGELASRKSGLIHEHEYIERITVPAARRRHETEVVWKSHAGRQHPAQREDALRRIVGIFVAAALWRLNDDGKSITVVGGERSEPAGPTLRRRWDGAGATTALWGSATNASRS